MSSAEVAAPIALPEDRKAAVAAELARILASPAFRGSRRCCRFLDYSVQHVLQGGSREDLRERNIGIDVFGRDPAYDTTEDATVRVTANEVRKRLAQYYQAYPEHSAVTITMPAGSYEVVFQWEEAAAETAPAPPLAAPVPAKRRWIPWTAAAAVLAVLAAAAIYLTRQPARAVTQPDAVWARVFDPHHKTNIVISDTVYRELQQYIGRDLSLRDYLAPGYPGNLVDTAPPALRPVIEFLGNQQTTSVGSASMAARLLDFGRRMGGNAAVRYPRHINGRDFNSDNFILLGSRLAIPWVELFDASLNFPLATEGEPRHYVLRNRVPAPGERPLYRMTGDETFADLAVLPNLSGSGTVLILNGIDMLAAETAGNFALEGGFAAALHGARYGEVLIRIRAIGGTAAKTEIVAIRTIAAAR